MSRGKYSPVWIKKDSYDYNCYGEIPEPYDGGDYDEKTHFADYDEDGYDRYGYSAFDADRHFVGAGNGVDRNGYTEMEYLSMSDAEWFNL